MLDIIRVGFFDIPLNDLDLSWFQIVMSFNDGFRDSISITSKFGLLNPKMERL
jgi:hypothetical protein